MDISTTTTLNSDTTVSSTDTWSTTAGVTNSAYVFTLSDCTAAYTRGSYTQTGGTLTLNNSVFTAGSSDSFTAGTVNVSTNLSELTINDAASFAANITNSGITTLKGGTRNTATAVFDKSVTGTGTTYINGDISMTGTNLATAAVLQDNSILRLSNATVSKDITGQGRVLLSGTSTLAADINTNMTVDTYGGGSSVSLNDNLTIGSDTKTTVNLGNWVTVHNANTTLIDGVSGDNKALLNISGYLTETGAGSNLSAVDIQINTYNFGTKTEGELVLNMTNATNGFDVGNINFTDGTGIFLYGTSATPYELDVADGTAITFAGNNYITGNGAGDLVIDGAAVVNGSLEITNRNVTITKGITGNGSFILGGNDALTLSNQTAQLQMSSMLQVQIISCQSQLLT